MITDNMFEKFWKTFNPSFGVEKHDAYEIWESSAEQARKEADEKLAIAVKALEEIKTLGTHSTLSGRTPTGERIDSTTIINTYGIKARDALKEIQG